MTRTDHRLARLRISVTTEPSPVGLSLPESLASVLATAAGQADRGRPEIGARIPPPQPSRLSETAGRPGRGTAATAGRSRCRATSKHSSNSSAEPLHDDPALVQLRADVAAQRRATQEQAIDCGTRSRLGADQQPGVLVQLLAANKRGEFTMWRLYGRPGKDVCDTNVGVTRRDVLRVGGAGMLGMTLGQVLRLQAAASDAGICRWSGLGEGQERHPGLSAGRAQPPRHVGPQA